MRWKVKGYDRAGKVKTVQFSARDEAHASKITDARGLVEIIPPLWFCCVVCRRPSIAAWFGSTKPCRRCQHDSVREAKAVESQRQIEVAADLFNELCSILADRHRSPRLIDDAVERAKSAGLRNVT